MRKSLQQIGEEYKTDKAITHFYCDNYEKYFEPLRDKEIVLLELGVAGGASIKMWREYFENAKVYGVDINPDCAGEGIFIGNATDEDFINKVLAEIGEPTIVVEDSGHVGHETIKIFELLFTKIKSGGYMAIEDTATFYSEHYSGGSNVFEFFTGLARDVDVAGRGMTGNTEVAINNYDSPPLPKYSKYLDCMFIHPSLWLFKRK